MNSPCLVMSNALKLGIAWIDEDCIDQFNIICESGIWRIFDMKINSIPKVIFI
jgi:hypothetical protein